MKAFAGDDETEYQLGIHYYSKNLEREAIFWLRKAVKKYNLKALELLQEINTKNYLLKLSAQMNKGKKSCQLRTINRFI